MEWVVDVDGSEIEGGRRVHVTGSPDVRGTVTGITDPDGDVDDEGHTIGISPRVVVMFDDGEDDRFTTSYTGRGPGEDAPWECEDLKVIEREAER
jgi:hypothetical protein